MTVRSIYLIMIELADMSTVVGPKVVAVAISEECAAPCPQMFHPFLFPIALTVDYMAPVFT